MGRRTTSKRAEALRKARQAKAARDAERLLREQRIEQALADFYEATGTAEQIREEARRRAARIAADAETNATAYDTAAGRAVRALRDLGQTNAEIAQLCDINVATIRALAGGNQAGGPSGQEDGARDAAPEPGDGRVPRERTASDTDHRADGAHSNGVHVDGFAGTAAECGRPSAPVGYQPQDVMRRPPMGAET